MTDLAKLRAFTLLNCLDDAALTETAQAMIWKTVQQGEQIIQSGDAGAVNDIFFLQSGRLMAVFFTPEGREIVFSVIPDGGYFGELAALDGQHRSLSIYASKTSQIGILPQKQFLKLIDQTPKFRKQVLQDMATRVRDLTRTVHELTSYSVKERVSIYIMRIAMDRDQFQENGQLDDFPTHSEVANQIGSNREAVSRTISALAHAGVIAAGRKSVRVLDPDALIPADLS